jgi:membrane protease YdiL (CAAX protease family)
MKEKMSPGTQVMMVLVFMVSALYLVGPLLFVLYATITNLTIPETEEGFYDPSIAYTSAAFGFIAIFIMPVLVFLKISNQKFNVVFKTQKFSLKFLGLSLLGITAMYFAADFLYLVNKILIDFIPNNSFAEMEAAKNGRYTSMFKPENVAYYPFAIAVFALLPAIVEELVFRGLVMKNLIESSGKVHFGVIVSSLLFAAFHVQAWNILPMTGLAMLFGYMYHYTKDIRYPIIMHFTYNTVQISFMFFMPEMMA